MIPLPDAIERYVEELAWPVPELEKWPAPARPLDAVAVIPALAERTTLPKTLRQLQQATETPERLEIIVVVNNGPDASDAVIQDNLETLDWIRRLSPRVPIHTLNRIAPERGFDHGPPGVGAARRLGLDAGLRRLIKSPTDTPLDARLLLSLDADAPPDRGYLDAIRRHWDGLDRASPTAALTRYAHRWSGRERARPVALYEIWLRLYDLAFEWAGSPFIFQALGSTQVLPAMTYARADGMPPMKAREDFAMIEKIIKNDGPGSVRRLTEPVVRPSGRTSKRAPLGTGQSVAELTDNGSVRAPTLPPVDAFRRLREMNRSLEQAYHAGSPGEAILAAADGPLADYLREINAPEHATKLAKHAPDAAGFVAQWHRWFDGRRTVSYTMRRADQDPTSLSAVAAALLDEEVPDALDSTESSLQLLEMLRRVDRQRGLA